MKTLGIIFVYSEPNSVFTRYAADEMVGRFTSENQKIISARRVDEETIELTVELIIKK